MKGRGGRKRVRTGVGRQEGTISRTVTWDDRYVGWEIVHGREDEARVRDIVCEVDLEAKAYVDLCIRFRNQGKEWPHFNDTLDSQPRETNREEGQAV